MVAEVKAYYNENDPKTAAWLRQLIRDGLIADGDVDDRSIVDVQPKDLDGYGQCHFFAGIGGWSLALRLAGVPDDEPVWTGSCPCQPFSLGGHRKGTADSRDLWRVFARIIGERRPAIVFGEQVESAIRWGWLDRLCDDLEGMHYACGAAVLSAGMFGAHHIRQRLYWSASADADKERRRWWQYRQTRTWSHEQFEGLVHASLSTATPSGSRDGLSDGVPARVVRGRGYGNAIVPQVGAAWIAAHSDLVSGGK